MKQQKLESTEIVRERERERELTFKPTTKENLVLFDVPKLYINNNSIKDELCKNYIIHLLFSLHRNKEIV